MVYSPPCRYHANTSLLHITTSIQFIFFLFALQAARQKEWVTEWRSYGRPFPQGRRLATLFLIQHTMTLRAQECPRPRSCHFSDTRPAILLAPEQKIVGPEERIGLRGQRGNGFVRPQEEPSAGDAVVRVHAHGPSGQSKNVIARVVPHIVVVGLTALPPWVSNVTV